MLYIISLVLNYFITENLNLFLTTFNYLLTFFYLLATVLSVFPTRL